MSPDGDALVALTESQDEASRLQALWRYQVLDTPQELCFDDLCLMASRICDTPVAFISFVDRDRQWLKSKVGLGIIETPRSIAFCDHCIRQQDVLVIEDTLQDPRFAQNPLVTGPPYIRFYAGAPLLTPEGLAIGSICVVDHVPRKIEPGQTEALRALGRHVITQLELKRRLAEQAESAAESKMIGQVIEDISEALRQSELRLFKFLEALPSGIMVVNADGEPCYANQASKNILGQGIIPDSHIDDLNEKYNAFIAGTQERYPLERMPLFRALKGERCSIDDMVVHRPDQIIPLQVQAAPVLDPDGSVRFAIASFIDISELRKNEARFRLLFDSNPLPTWVYNLETLHFLEVNAVAVSTYGYTREEFLNMKVTDVGLPEDVPRFLDRVRLFRSRPGQQLSGLWRHRRKDGRIIEVQVGSSRLELADRWEMLVVAEDVTERRRLLNALRKSEELYRNIVETAQEGIWSIDAAGNTTFINRRMAEMLGASPEDVAGAPLLSFLDAESQTVALALMGNRRRGVVQQRDLRFQRADGTHLWAMLSLSPLHDSKGLFSGGLAMVTDITERKLAEEKLRASSLQLEQSNRDLNDFASVAAHDLQEPLRKIQAFGDRLKKRFGDVLADDGKDYLERMLGATQRMQNLIESLLALSRVTTKAQPSAPVDLGRVVREVLIDLEVILERTGGRVEFGNLPIIHADRFQMRQLLQNLIGNALKFSRPDQPPVVKVDAMLAPLPQQRRGAHPRPGLICHLTVEDNGIGFEETYLDRIFKPFERLHSREQYEGTGMGLAICRKIAERHGGNITARSAPNQGSTFVITLPAGPSREESQT